MKNKSKKKYIPQNACKITNIFFIYFRSRYGFKIVALNISGNSKNKSNSSNNSSKNHPNQTAIPRHQAQYLQTETTAVPVAVSVLTTPLVATAVFLATTAVTAATAA